MRSDDPQLLSALSNGFTRYLLVDVLNGTDRVARDVFVDSWSLSPDLERDPKTTGTLTITRPSVKGESWVPDGVNGILSPFRATLVLTEVINAGGFETRVQLGLFDVVSVPYAEDITASVNYRFAEGVFPGLDVLPGESLTPGGAQALPGSTVVVATVFTVEVESLDARALNASLRRPRTTSGSAWAEWRHLGLLPVIESVTDVTLPKTTWPAEQGSRLDAVQTCARYLGGVPVVDSFGQWVLITEDAPTVTLETGESGTITEVSSTQSTDGFYNVVVGDYETESGRPIRAVWEAPGDLAPSVLGREWVRYHSSDMVRTQAAAEAAVESVGVLGIAREVDLDVECIYNPVLELGDRVLVDGVEGVAWAMSLSDAPTMRVTVRTVRHL